MDYAIGQPCHDAKEGACVCRKNVAQVGSVEDVLERWEDADPYRRAPSAGDEPWSKRVSPLIERSVHALRSAIIRRAN